MQVHFVTEEAVDTGGPSREFWRLFASEVVLQFCEGEAGKCLFMKNVPALQVCHECTVIMTIVFSLPLCL